VNAHARAVFRSIAIAALVAGAGCVSLQSPPFMRPAPARQWPSTLETAQGLVRARQFDAADSLLASFASRYPGSAESFESSYWRALYKMDPLNPHPSLATAVAALDAYIGNTKSHEHAPEAATLRRVAAQIENLNRLAANALSSTRETPGQPTDTVTVKVGAGASTAADEEIKRLRDELAKANAELDRIRRRLAQPPGKPPR